VRRAPCALGGPACVRRRVRERSCPRARPSFHCAQRSISAPSPTRRRWRETPSGRARLAACVYASSKCFRESEVQGTAAHPSTASYSPGRCGTRMLFPSSSRLASGSDHVASDPPSLAIPKRECRRVLEFGASLDGSGPSPSRAPEAPARGELGATRWEGTGVRARARLDPSRAGRSSSSGSWARRAASRARSRAGVARGTPPPGSARRRPSTRAKSPSTRRRTLRLLVRRPGRPSAMSERRGKGIKAVVNDMIVCVL
jgi:hypothetical protein